MRFSTKHQNASARRESLSAGATRRAFALAALIAGALALGGCFYGGGGGHWGGGGGHWGHGGGHCR